MSSLLRLFKMGIIGTLEIMVKKMKKITSILKYASLILAVFIYMIPANAATSNSQKLIWVGDIPLMQGMVVRPDLSFNFDSLSGRILVIYAVFKVDDKVVYKDRVSHFYNDLLPSLGWRASGKQESDMYFHRDDEMLVMSQVDIGDVSLWRFALTPRR